MTETLEKTYTHAEYFALEKNSLKKLEYFNGTIITMSGGTFQHNEIAARILAMLVFAIDEKEKVFHVCNSDMKIQIPSLDYFVYPDAVVVSEKPKFYNNRKDVITNPLLIVEVLSPSTQNYDRGGKFMAYRTLPSFKEYVLVNQFKPMVTTFFRKAAHHWEDQDVEGTDKSVRLQSIDCEIALSRIYKGAELK